VPASAPNDSNSVTELHTQIRVYKEGDVRVYWDSEDEGAQESNPLNVYTQGVSWCSDGTWLLSVVHREEGIDASSTSGPGATSKARVVLYPKESTLLDKPRRIHQRDMEAIYSCAWFPQASLDPSSFCVAVSSRGHPVNIYDGNRCDCLRGSYVPMDDRSDAMVMDPVYSVAFGQTGQYLYAGVVSRVYMFETCRPGKSDWYFETHPGKKCIISCLTPGVYGSALQDVLAVGSYGPENSVVLYDAHNEEMLCSLQGHAGGVTHMVFSADGNYLYTGARKNGTVYCWDARFMSGAVYSIERSSCRTYQKVYFDIEPSGRCLATGGDDGLVRLFDLRDGSSIGSFEASDGGLCVNGCSFHPNEPLLATSSGERQYDVVNSSSIRLWSYPTYEIQ
jgi:WD40 repeat protein